MTTRKRATGNDDNDRENERHSGHDQRRVDDDTLAAATRFQRDLYLYCQVALASGGLPLTTRGYLTRPALRRLRERMSPLIAHPGESAATPAETSEADDPLLFFQRRLLERLGLLRLSPDHARLLPADRSEVNRYFDLPLTERLRLCSRLWVAGGWWPDRVDARAEPPRLLVPAVPRVALVRRRLLHILSATEPGGRIPIPAPYVPTSTATSLRQRSARSKHAAQSRLAPIAAPGESDVQRAALLGPLLWLGFVTLDHSAATESRATTDPTLASSPACRATPAVHALREPGGVPSAPPPPQGAHLLQERTGRVSIQPNFTVVAYPPLTAPLLALLDSCADETSHELAVTYQLTRPSLLRALRLGYELGDLLARLVSFSAAPLPPNVATTLADWARQAERVQLTPSVTVLEVASPALLDALLADRASAAWVVRRLTPTTAALSPEGAANARGWLLRRGQLPAMITSTRVPASASELPDQQ